MRNTIGLWIIAFVVAVFAAHYQRTTGPTYPVLGKATLGPATFKYRFERSHPGAGDQRVEIRPGTPEAEGTLAWQHVGAGDTWTIVPMRREGEALVAEIPHQPVSGKVAYRLTLRREGQQIVLPERGPAVLRFRGDVPGWVLIPHILAMIGALLLAARAGLEAFSRAPQFRKLTDWTLVVLFIGGFVLGPLVTWYGFRSLWSGFPVGNDLTDNKTLLALIGWLVAAVAVRRAGHPGPWVGLAAVLTFLVYLIPHSISMPR